MRTDPTPLRSATAIDALAALGFSMRAIRDFVAAYATWGELYADSLAHRVAVGGVGARWSIPERCPALRPAQFGQIVSYCDPVWPRALDRLSDGPSVIEMSGRLVGKNVCIAGSRYPSAGAMRAARLLGTEAAAQNIGVVAVPEGVGMHALRGAVDAGGRGVGVLYGDSPTHLSRGALGGVVARYFGIHLPAEGGAVVHVRHPGGEDLGAPVAYAAAAALGETVFLLEAGVGRAGTSWSLRGAHQCGGRVLWVRGDEGRGERMTPTSAVDVVETDEIESTLRRV